MIISFSLPVCVYTETEAYFFLAKQWKLSIFPSFFEYSIPVEDVYVFFFLYISITKANNIQNGWFLLLLSLLWRLSLLLPQLYLQEFCVIRKHWEQRKMSYLYGRERKENDWHSFSHYSIRCFYRRKFLVVVFVYLGSIVCP